MDVLFTGHIEGLRYTDNSVIVTASERRSGYKTREGIVVKDEILTYRFLFKSYFRKYIAEHFADGMYVKIKGFMLPYVRDSDGNTTDGFSIIGQTIDMAAYPTRSAVAEKRMIKESQRKLSDEKPDLASFNQPDF